MYERTCLIQQTVSLVVWGCSNSRCVCGASSGGGRKKLRAGNGRCTYTTKHKNIWVFHANPSLCRNGHMAERPVANDRAPRANLAVLIRPVTAHSLANVWFTKLSADGAGPAGQAIADLAGVGRHGRDGTSDRHVAWLTGRDRRRSRRSIMSTDNSANERTFITLYK